MSDDQGNQAGTSSLSITDESRLISNINLRGLVLELVFETLKEEHESLAICTRVSREWDEILWRRKPEFLFPLAIPLLSKYLSFQGLLQCRAVSSTWKRAVENLNNQFTPESGLRCPQIEMRASRRLAFDGWTRFNIDRRPKEFMKHARETYDSLRDNPFPSRAVMFKNSTKPPPNLIADLTTMYYDRPNVLLQKFGVGAINHIQKSMECAIEFYEMLKVFGAEIAHLEYSVTDCFEDILPEPRPFIVAEFLTGMLRLVPNLVSLTLQDDKNCYGGSLLVGIPTPPLANLVDLRLNLLTHQTISHFFLTAYGHQLEHLVCSDEDLIYDCTVEDETPTAVSFRLSKLKTLSVLADEAYMYYRDADDHELYFDQLSSRVIAPSLHTLSFEVLQLPSDVSTVWNLMSVLEAFKSSIEKVYVNVLAQSYRNDDSGRPPSWLRQSCAETETGGRTIGQLPHLSTFHIEGCLSPLSSNFRWMLGKMSGLENLKLHWKTTDSDNKESVDKVAAHLLQTSPTLRTINVEITNVAEI